MLHALDFLWLIANTDLTVRRPLFRVLMWLDLPLLMGQQQSSGLFCQNCEVFRL